MRIIKPNKPSASGADQHREQSGGIAFTIEELDLNSGLDKSHAPGSTAKGRSKTRRRHKSETKADISEDSMSFIDGDFVAAGGGDAERGRKQAKKEYNRLLAKGVRLLSMREHSVLEMRNKLSVKCLSADIVAAVLEDLVDKKYLSDLRFTESYVRARQNRGFGPSKIRKELLDKGIKNSMVDDYLNANSAVWFENALNQYQKKFGIEPVTDYNNWAKRARFLQSRGFSMEHIQVTVPRIDYD